MNNQYIPTDKATNGTTRTINKVNFNTAELVNTAIEQVSAAALDLEAAKKSLAFLGNVNPTDDQVLRYATEFAILKVMDRMTGANFQGQIGKWNMTTAESINCEVNSYLNRRNSARKSRWGK